MSDLLQKTFLRGYLFYVLSSFLFPIIFLCYELVVATPGDELELKIASKAFLIVTKKNLIWMNFVSKNIEMGWFSSRRGTALLDNS